MVEPIMDVLWYLRKQLGLGLGCRAEAHPTCQAFSAAPRIWDTGWPIQDLNNAACSYRSLASNLRDAFGPSEVLSTLLLLQQGQSDASAGLSLLPTSLIRTICQQLSHADIEQCRLVCKSWRSCFGQASVTDMYLAMCANFERASQLTTRFIKAYPNFHHLHFWIPGGPVRQMMGTDSSTFQQYMELFSTCTIRALTAHYLDDQVCALEGITQLSGLTKLELVDLLPASVSLSCLSALPVLRHLIVEYKDSSATPDLRSIGDLQKLTQLELSLHSTFVNNPVYVTLPAGVKLPAALTGSAEPEWMLSMLSPGALPLAGSESSEAERYAALQVVLAAAQTSSQPMAASVLESAASTASSESADVLLEAENGEPELAGQPMAGLAEAVAALDALVAALGGIPIAPHASTVVHGVAADAADVWNVETAPLDDVPTALAGDVAGLSGAAAAADVPSVSGVAAVPGSGHADAESMMVAEVLGTLVTDLADVSMSDHEAMAVDAHASIGMSGASVASVTAEGDDLPASIAEASGMDTAAASATHDADVEAASGVAAAEVSNLATTVEPSLIMPALELPVHVTESMPQDTSPAAAAAAYHVPSASIMCGGAAATATPSELSVEACPTGYARTGEEAAQAQAVRQPASMHGLRSIQALAAEMAAAICAAVVERAKAEAQLPRAHGGEQMGQLGTSSSHDILRANMNSEAGLPPTTSSIESLGDAAADDRAAAGLSPAAELNPPLAGSSTAEVHLASADTDAPQAAANAPDSATQPQEDEQQAASASGASPSSGCAICAASQQQSLAVSSSDYLLANMMAHWTQLRNLQRLEIRGAPAGLACRYPLLFDVLPSLTEVKLVGQDTRLLEVHGPAQPAFKVEVSRHSSSLALSPASLSLSLHCDSAAATRTAIQHLAAIAAARASATCSKNPAAAAAAPACSIPAPATRAGVGRGAAWVPWSSPRARSPAAAPAAAVTLSPAAAAAEEKLRQQVLRQHPGLCILNAHAVKLATLRVYIENPEFAALKPLRQLSHLRELHVVVCYTSDSDSESDDEAADSTDDDDISMDEAVGPHHNEHGEGDQQAMSATNVSMEAHDAIPAVGMGTAAAGPAGAPLAPAVPASGNAAATSDEDGLEVMMVGNVGADGEPVGPLADESAVGFASATAPNTAASASQLEDLSIVSAMDLLLGGPQPLPAGPTSGLQNLVVPWAHPELNPRHVMAALKGMSQLTSLTVREEIPASSSHDEGSPGSHEQCALGPACCEALARSMHNLVTLEWQGLLASPHPSSLQALAGLTSLRNLTLAVNQDDPVARLGLHCLPQSLTSLTLQNISVASPPLGSTHQLPTLCHLHLKSCALPDLSTFSVAPTLEWLSLDNCDAPVYVPDLVALWPSLSWLEITYTHQDWRLLHSPSDLPALGRLTRLRKLSLVTPYEEGLTTDALLGLTQLRLLSVSPSLHMSYDQLMRLAEFRFLAGLEVKLYSDVPHHEELVDLAGAMHADMQEALPMTDVLIMVDDSYADDPS